MVWLTPRRGFSFLEVMFAVMILGIGFILMAGVFPVALSQTQAGGDETVAASVGREAAAYLANLPGTARLMSADGAAHRFGPGGLPVVYNRRLVDADAALWDQVRGDVIVSADARYAWVPFYLRRVDPNGQPSPCAQVTIIVTRVRNHSAYSRDLDCGTGSGSDFRTTLMGRPVSAMVVAGAGNEADTITFTGGDTNAVAPGALVVVSTDAGSGAGGVSAAGWVLKVGNPIDAAEGRWQLAAGGDVKNSPGYTPGAIRGWVVGRGSDPDRPDQFDGGSQDVMAYTTLIVLK